MAESYYELLKRPEWQKKRLRVMEAAGFECVICGAADKTLNVHHRYYLKDHKPWEYPEKHLDCMCEPCHKLEHERRDELKLLMGEAGTAEVLDEIIGYVKAMILRGRAGPADQPRLAVGSYEEACGMSNLYHIRGNDGVDAIIQHAASQPDSCVDHAALWGIRRAQMAADKLETPANPPPPPESAIDHERQRSSLRA